MIDSAKAIPTAALPSAVVSAEPLAVVATAFVPVAMLLMASSPATVIDDPAPVEADVPIPLPSAADIFRRSGVSDEWIDGHVRGELFWSRSDHQEDIKRWISDGVPLSEIVVRIQRAWAEDKFPKDPNGMKAFDRFVLGEV